MTLIELVLAMALATLAVAATSAYSLPWMQQQTMRSSAYTVQSHLQLARIEAISRNRQVRFVVDSSTNQVWVMDSMGTTGDTTDDVILYEEDLSDAVLFARPDLGDAVTLDAIDGTNAFQALFEADGSVPADSIGEVFLHGGDDFGQIAVFGAGAIVVEDWNGSGWD